MPKILSFEIQKKKIRVDQFQNFITYTCSFVVSAHTHIRSHSIASNKKQARIAADLKELRNKSVFAFFMFNALFVLIVFLLQLNKDKIHVNWPLGIKTNITYDEITQEV